ncbi:MAG: sulfotransferase [Opitutales bacterium]
MTDSSKPTIVFIGGYGRSGSTMLDRVLGEIPGTISLGEVRHIWQRAFRENQWVGDSVPFRECPFWESVIEKAYGGYDQIDLDEVDRLRGIADRLRAIPKLRQLSSQPEEFKEAVAAFSEILFKLYSSISDVSGSGLLIDSSKHPCYAHLLLASGRFNMKILHIVRDPRATAHSWQRKRKRPEIHWENKDMPTFNPVTSSLHWCAANRLMETFKKDIPEAYHLMRYEDLVQDPQSAIRAAWGDFDLPEPDLSFFSGKNEAVLANAFTVAGNPFRFKKGTISIKPDDEWKQAMKASTKFLVSSVSVPYLLKYKYF